PTVVPARTASVDEQTAARAKHVRVVLHLFPPRAYTCTTDTSMEAVTPDACTIHVLSVLLRAAYAYALKWDRLRARARTGRELGGRRGCRPRDAAPDVRGPALHARGRPQPRPGRVSKLPPKPYDLLWPVSYWKSKGAQSTAKVIEEPKQLSKKPESSSAAPLRRDSRGGSLEELQDYATHLLSSLSDPDSRVKLPLEAIELERDREREEAGGLSGCRQAVEIITRNPRKASYDVNKDGVKVAVLTFTKSAYRLGETVLGVVELNERPSRARVLKVTLRDARGARVAAGLAVSRDDITADAARARRAPLFIPAVHTADDILARHTAGREPRVPGRRGCGPGRRAPRRPRVEVRLCLLVAVASPTARVGADGARLRHLVRDGPGGQWGASWKAASTIAPMERPDLRAAQGAAAQSPVTPGTAASWLSYFTAPLMGPASTFHDGDDDVSDEGGTVIGDSEEEWREVKAEMVECEVPIRVWPGNTAFKATEVVFDV
ncbi:hypothetical protein EVJ58_g9327, partial [Rhodofomes roseus]